MRVLQRFTAQKTQDGAGVNISRVADFQHLQLDPFLMVDELKSDNPDDFIAGFPPHPHRGIETFTYMIKGGFEHRDQLGNQKVISDGDVQWMSTGFGVVHSEMPVAAESGMHGFQIWLNMPAKDKLRPARYQDSTANALPTIELKNGIWAKSLAGDWQIGEHHITSSIGPLSGDAAIADIRLPASRELTLNLRHFEQVFVYIHSGSLANGSRGTLLLLDSSEAVKLTTTTESAGLLIFAGNKINEQIAHMGPFVMNTQAELQQAIRDYQSGKFGELTV